MCVWGQPQRHARVRAADVCPAGRFLSPLGAWVLFAGQSPMGLMDSLLVGTVFCLLLPQTLCSSTELECTHM